ncbi:hypothetical protein LTR36_001455 [Oleoguttula mirabilis]|uniref:Uncharacterized protein n=1 Tax=Oleoguttula mirabilis TaxID=1507867 RepID=A0AAV9J3I5_9PEZI|nr:hypothetical protein LTR36_001455 [Oleoguttula mirabilis]
MEEAKNIRKLTVESPLCNLDRWRDAHHEQWPETMRRLFAPLRAAAGWTGLAVADRPLQNLRKLTLHLNGSKDRYWDIGAGSTAAIFAHPTLEELTISCANLSDTAFSSVDNKAHQTTLKRLTLIECNVTISSLRDMLALPKALQSLYLGGSALSLAPGRNPYRDLYGSEEPADTCAGENSYHHPSAFSVESGALCKNDPPSFFAALAQQAKSLEQLDYETANVTKGSATPSLPEQHAGLRDFVRLHTVTLAGMYCSEFEEVLLCSRMAPPMLTALHVVTIIDAGGAGGDGNGHPPLAWTRSMASALPNLAHVHVTILALSSPLGRWANFHRPTLQAAEAEFGARKLTLWVYKRNNWSNCFPPYLHGEEPNEGRLVYVSDGRGFVEQPRATSEP